MINFDLQPKQSLLLRYLNQEASWIGIGGGRGGAKSTALQRCMLVRRESASKTLGAIVMRNYDQVKRYHVDPMLRDFPELAPNYMKTESKLIIPGRNKQAGNSEIHFTYAESLEDVIRRFRSASYYDVFVDQAEQFSEDELREIKQCVRWSKVPQGTCKLVLSFNMGGNIDFLRRIFHLHEYNRNERAEDFAFIHVFPWDNVEWVRPALASDGLTEDDYYRKFTEKQRMAYCATRGDYGRNLVGQDEPLMKRDWLGSWETLEGAYFARVFDRQSTVLTEEQVKLLLKPWTKRWMSQDWGRGHYCSHHWHGKVEISPKEAKEVLNWDVDLPFSAVITYREYIAGGAADKDEGGQRELAEQDIAYEIVRRTGMEDMRSFFLSPDAFAKRTSQHTIAQIMGKVLRSGGLPSPVPADDDRIGGWSLIYELLLGAKRHGNIPMDGKVPRGADVWLISGNCTELIDAIPLLMRDPKNLDDVLKTDKGKARIEQDVADDVRYGLKSMLMPTKKPMSVEMAEVLDSITDMHKKSMTHRAMLAKKSHGVSRAFYVH